MTDASSSPSGTQRVPFWDRLWVQIALVTAAWACVSLVGVSHHAVSGPDEPRYAAACQTMLETGDWIVPRFNGRDRLVKPILTYWLIAAVSWPGGEVTSVTARVPPLAFALVMALSVLWIGRRLFGARPGLIAALMLCATPFFASMGRKVLTDMIQAGCITAALAGFVAAETAGESRRRRAIGLAVFYVSLGLGCQAKGPLTGTLLPLAVAAAWRSVREGVSSLPRRTGWWWGLPLAFAIGASWFLILAWFGRTGDMIEVFLKQNVERAVNPFDHLQAVHYYLTIFPGQFAPWVLLIPVAVLELAAGAGLRPDRRFAAGVASLAAFVVASLAAGSPPRGQPLGPLHWTATALFAAGTVILFLWLRPAWKSEAFLPVLWFGLVWLTFTASGSKRAIYILPLLPAAALFVAGGIGRLSERADRGEAGAWERRLFYWPVALAAAALVAAPIAGHVLVARRWPQYAHLAPPYYALCIAGAIVLGWCCLRRTSPRTVACAAAAVATAAIAWTYHSAIHDLDEERGTERFCRYVAEKVGDRALYTGKFEEDAELVFHLRREVKELAEAAGRGEELAAAKAAKDKQGILRLRLDIAREMLAGRASVALVLTDEDLEGVPKDAIERTLGGALLGATTYQKERVYLVGNR